MLMVLFIAPIANAEVRNDSDSVGIDTTGSVIQSEPGCIASGVYDGVEWRFTADHTLIFGRKGTTEVSHGGSSSNDRPWLEYCDEIEAVQVAEAGRVVWTGSLDYFFESEKMLKRADLSRFDTSSVDSMSCMFIGCSSLQAVDFSGFDTSNVVGMSSMFGGCTSLTTVDVSAFNTANVKDMSYMFENCTSLKTVDVSGFNTSKVTNTASMFNGCSLLEYVRLSAFDTSKVEDMSCMFSGCSSLTSVDVSGFDTTNVVGMDSMFSGCSSLASVDVSGFETSKVESMCSMFSGCSSLVSVDISGFDTSRVEYLDGMFSGCSSLVSVDVSSFETSKAKFMDCMYCGCTRLKTIISSGSFSTSEYSYKMFQGCTSLVGGNGTKYSEAHVDGEYARIDGEGGLPGYFTAKDATNEPADRENPAPTDDPEPNIDPKPSVDPTPTSIDGMAVALSATSLPYNGKAQKPAVKTVGGKALVAGADYDVTYSDAASRDAGTYTLTVTGKGAYAGTATASYKIVHAKNSAKAAKAKVSKSLKAKALKKKAQKVALPKVKAAFGKAKWTVAKKDKKGVLKLKGNKVVVKKGARKGTYTIKLKAKVKATKNWKAASTKAVTVKVKVK